MADEGRKENDNFALERRLEAMAREIARLGGRIREIEAPHHSTPIQPITHFDADGYFDWELVDGKLTLQLDADALRETMPPLPKTGVDRWIHCTDQEKFHDIYLPTDIADGIVAAGGGVKEGEGNFIVVKITTANDGTLCYYLAEVNVKHSLTTGVTVSEVVDSCDVCEDDPQSGDSGNTGTPIPSGNYVTDVNCANDGSGDLMVSVLNAFNGKISVYRKTGCCCDSGDSGGDSGDTMDRWETCDTSSLPDLYLNTGIFDNANSADPIILLIDNGCCYTLAERGTTGNLESDYDLIQYADTCSDSICDDCTDAPASCPYVDVNSGSTTIKVGFLGWDGAGVEGNSGSTITVAKSGDAAGNCSPELPPVHWNKFLDRNISPAVLETATAFAQYCFWYRNTAAGTAEDMDGIVMHNITRVGYNTDLSEWVAIVNHVYDNVSCLDRRSVWVKTSGADELGTYRPATQAELVTMSLNSDTYIRATNGTLSTTFVN
jgi:hypothetical protein